MLEAGATGARVDRGARSLLADQSDVEVESTEAWGAGLSRLEEPRAFAPRLAVPRDRLPHAEAAAVRELIGFIGIARRHVELVERPGEWTPAQWLAWENRCGELRSHLGRLAADAERAAMRAGADAPLR
jgi:hypothetical protein